jgi:putative hydrolase of the HAD superfamily
MKEAHMPRTRGFPEVVCINLDDTILSDDTSPVHEAWVPACASYAAQYVDTSVTELVDAIKSYRDWYWSDPERHRVGRLHMQATRTEIVRQALASAGIAQTDLAETIATAYARLRDEGRQPLPSAMELLQTLQGLGVKVVLITNGESAVQRRKIEQFGLCEYFTLILIEGEQPYGKPEPEMYQLALTLLGADASQVWMIGDNLDWDVRAPQSLGIYSIWVDHAGQGVPPGSSVVPDLIICTLGDLLVRPAGPC